MLIVAQTFKIKIAWPLSSEPMFGQTCAACRAQAVIALQLGLVSSVGHWMTITVHPGVVHEALLCLCNVSYLMPGLHSHGTETLCCDPGFLAGSMKQYGQCSRKILKSLCAGDDFPQRCEISGAGCKSTSLPRRQRFVDQSPLGRSESPILSLVFGSTFEAQPRKKTIA